MNLMVGQRATRSLTLTAESVKAFASLTGDYNPLHFDAEFAAGTPFKRLPRDLGCRPQASSTAPKRIPGRPPFVLLSSLEWRMS
jgi:3-hydroxybutyryl-CoA dehydratase